MPLRGPAPAAPLDLTTAASADDFHAALARALADDTCDAVVVTAIPTVGEGAAGDAALAEALRSAAAAVPTKPVLVVHVELGGLAEALSAATSTAPQADPAPTAPTAPDPAALPAPGAAADSAPGVAPPAVPGTASRVEPGSAAPAPSSPTADSAPGAARQATGGAAPQADPGLASPAAPGAPSWATPGTAADSTPGTSPGAAPGSVTGTAPDALSGAAPSSPARGGPSSTPPAAPGGAAAASSGSSAAPPPAPSQPAAPAPAPAGTHLIPAYPAAERAVRALGEAVAYAQWRREAADPGKVPEYEDIDEKGAAEQIAGLLARGQGLTLGDRETCDLLGRYGVHVHRALPAPTPDDAAAAARTLGYPVALKATAPHLRHRADLGGVRLDLADEEQLRRAYAELTELFGKPAELRPVVQGMAPRGVDTVVRAVIDPAAGAVLSFGLAGAATQLLGDMAHRLIPVTDRDATSLIRSIRTAPLLFGWRGSAPVDSAALEELLLRVSRLVDDHPEVVAVTLEPVVVAPHGLSVLGASVRLAPPPARDDLGPRTMPAY